jgi:hypothetical protein
MNDSIRLNGCCHHGIIISQGCESCRKEQNEITARQNNNEYPVTKNNNAMLEISLLLRDLVRDLDDFLPIETVNYYKRIDAVLAKLQQ